jgi:hypothetical protein
MNLLCCASMANSTIICGNLIDRRYSRTMSQFFTISLTILLLAINSPLLGADGSMNFSSFPLPARLGGGGGPGLTLSEGAAAHFANPAALTNMRQIRNELLLSHLILREERSLSLASYARQTDANGFFAGSLTSYLVRGIEERNSLGEKLGTFSNLEMALSLAHARILTYSWRVGATVNYFYQQLATHKANGYGLDLGAIYRPFITYDILLGLNLRNLLAGLSWDTDASDRPAFTPEIGLSYSPLGWPVSVALDYIGNQPWSEVPLRIGVEGWTYQEQVGMRLGWADQLLTTGLSYKDPANYRLDYSFSYRPAYLGDAHSIDLSYYF